MSLRLLALLDVGSALLEPDALGGSSFSVVACSSLGDLWSTARRTPGSVAAVVDWRRVVGLLSEEHGHFLSDVDQAVPLILLFDHAFGRHMVAHDLGVTAVLDKPIRQEDLVELLDAIATQEVATL